MKITSYEVSTDWRNVIIPAGFFSIVNQTSTPIFYKEDIDMPDDNAVLINDVLSGLFDKPKEIFLKSWENYQIVKVCDFILNKGGVI